MVRSLNGFTMYNYSNLFIMTAFATVSLLCTQSKSSASCQRCAVTDQTRSPLTGDGGQGRRGRGSQGRRGRGRGGRGSRAGGNAGDTVTQSEAERFVDQAAAEGRKRGRDDGSLHCEVVTGETMGKAVRDPQGNEYVMQTRGRRSGRP